MSQHPFQNFMVRFRGGETIFAEGEQGSTMFIVQAGRVGLFREANDDKSSLGVLEKGDFFGEMSILEGRPRTHSAEAIEDTDLIEINKMIFDKMIRSNIEIAVRMLRKLSIRLREAESKVSNLELEGVTTSRPAVGETTAKPKAGSTGVRLESDEQDVVFELIAPETMIGRFDPVTELTPDIDLTNLDLKRSVSRQHARIVFGPQGHLVFEEIGALNGTFVNDTKLVAGEGKPIKDGDRLRVGNVGMIFRV